MQKHLEAHMAAVTVAISAICDISEMEDSLLKKEFVSVLVRDPQLHKEDFWHTCIDYEICLHLRFSRDATQKHFHKRMQQKCCIFPNLFHMFMLFLCVLSQLPKLPSANLFFSLSNTLQVAQHMEGLQRFLEAVLKVPLLLSDSHLHLFLQSQLSIDKIEACVQGQTSYTVADSIQCYVYDTHFPLEDKGKSPCNSDCESTSFSGLGISIGSAAPIEMSTQNGSLDNQFLAMALDPEPFRCSSSSPECQQDTHLLVVLEKHHYYYSSYLL
ncbi:sorting nexin-10A-like [Hemibagrus wyckioides]|uniref:sorting nexin-10A-like n=1 Tax=Hemibagrus wyckioides TaxID=337641 RepID=UPI00266C90A0|nr:sorting nexin-10A-like [Hemibagrus wyckioides]